jgi:hypothetical protein
MASEAELLPYLSEDPRLDYYTIEITHSSVWAEVTRPMKLPKGSFFANITMTLCPDLPDTFTILDLSLATKQAILENKWYDPGNPHMIIWPEPNRMIFNRAITDVSYLADHLLPYVVNDDDSPVQTIEPLPDNQKFIVKITGEKPEREKASWKVKLDPAEKHARFVIAPGLRAVLATDSRFPTYCLTFLFRSILARTLRYIGTHRERLISPWDTNIIDLREDPLGKAFGVQAFKRSQLGHYIRRCLAKVYDEDAWTIPPLGPQH